MHTYAMIGRRSIGKIMFEKLLRIYSALFRYAGLAIALMSLVVSAVIGMEIAQQGYILVNGNRSHALGSIATAVGTPLIGVVIGLALYFLVPKMRRPSGGVGFGGFADWRQWPA